MISKDTFIAEILENGRDYDIARLEKAFDTAVRQHEGQARKSGEPYVTHPIKVAEILADLGMDTDAIIAGLLHDAVEDTPYTAEDIEKDFGSEVALLVGGVTKLDSLVFSPQEEVQAQNLRKMFLAMSKDIRVLIIKLADRLHNLRTINYMTKEQIKVKCRETIEIYAPLAGRLGISKIKTELEDIALKYLEPEVYKDLADKVSLKRGERQAYIDKITATLKKRIEELKIDAEVTGRFKHFYSIYRKLKAQHKQFDEIFDTMAVRIIVPEVRQCYEILGLVHTLWTPLPGRFKDYISMPKPNRYQSIHTSVLGEGGQPFEIQIRTIEMHRVAEYGACAHWKYKEGIKDEGEDENKLAWIKQALEWQQDLDDPKEFMQTLKVDLFASQIFVFSPKGQIVELPAGSTPLDFAYKIHTDVGNAYIGAKVNEKMVTIDHELQNGEIVEIINSTNSSGPSLDWIKIAKSAHAKNKIRAWLRKHGKIEQDARAGKTAAHAKTGKASDRKGEVSLPAQAALSSASQTAASKDAKLRSDIYIEGADEAILIRLGRCCSPIPGDEIIAYITKGRGITVHRTDCKNISLLPEKEKPRLLKAEWNSLRREESYEAHFAIYSAYRRGLIADISRVALNLDVEILTLNMNKAKDDHFLIDLTLKIDDLAKMDKFTARARQIVGVLEIKRVNS
jgi:GTP pyrophosphokinase